MKYFSQLKRFLAIPKHFRGVSDSAENLVFPSIVDRNAHRFSHLFRKAEELFARLDKVKERYGDRFGERFLLKQLEMWPLFGTFGLVCSYRKRSRNSRSLKKENQRHL